LNTKVSPNHLIYLMEKISYFSEAFNYVLRLYSFSAPLEKNKAENPMFSKSGFR
jgi:hypothetical protein